MSIVAIDIGGTKISGAVLSRDGELFIRHKYLLENRTGKEAGMFVSELILDLISEAVVDRDSMVAGISVPGIVYPGTGRIWAPNIPGWEQFPLREMIAEKTGIPEAHIHIGSDRTCSILGEVWKGAARGSSDALFIAVGTGIGVGIMVNGQLLHGMSDIAGAAGWMALEPPYHEKFDGCGCFEYYASGTGIGNRAVDYLKDHPEYQGPMRDKKLAGLSAYDVFQHYDDGDLVSLRVIAKAIEQWGMASANLVSLLNPHKVVWGGGIFGPAKRFIPDIYREALRWAQPISIRQTEFVASELGEDAALYGAASLYNLKS